MNAPTHLPLIFNAHSLRILATPSLPRRNWKLLSRHHLNPWPSRRLDAIRHWPRRACAKRARQLLLSWESLGETKSFSHAEILTNLLRVLVSALPANPALGSPVTRYPTDLRPLLSERLALRSVLIELAPWWKEALATLASEGLAVAGLTKLPPSAAFCVDPYALVHWKHVRDLAEECELFRGHRSLLPHLTGMAWSEVVNMQQAFQSLCEYSTLNDGIREEIYSRPNAASWFCILMSLGEDLRPMFLAFVRDRPTLTKRHVDKSMRQCFLRAADSGTSESILDSWRFLALGILEGLPAPVLKEHFLLRRRFKLPNQTMGPVAISPRVHRAFVRFTERHRLWFMEESWRISNWRALVAESSALKKFILESPSRYNDSSIALAFEWWAIHAECEKALTAPRLERWFQRAYHQACAVPWENAKDYWTLLYQLSSPEYWKEAEDARFELALSWATLGWPLYQKLEPAAKSFLDTLICIVPATCLRVLRTGDDAFLKRIAKHLRSENWGDQIEDGLRVVKRFPVLANPQALLGATKPYLNVLAALALVPKHELPLLVERYCHHPLMELDAEHLSPDLLGACYENAGLPNPLNKSRQLPLNHPRRKHDHERLRASLAHLKLMALSQEIDRLLPDTNGLDPHTWPFIRLLTENERQAKRWLCALRRGIKDYHLQHPKNLTWQREHPEINWELWLRGIRLDIKSKRHGKLVLALENDPEEALKMGTKVNSCLGLGGFYAHAALLNVLDVNKQCVFARNARGQILGRVLLALSDVGKLVCFIPYVAVNTHQNEIRAALLQFARSFAQTLSLQIQDGDKDDYVITPILAKEWYDDGALSLAAVEGKEEVEIA